MISYRSIERMAARATRRAALIVLAAMALGMHFTTARAQVNAEQVTAIGRNVLSMDDYMLAIHYFNMAIKAKDYLAEPYFYRAVAKMKLDDFRGAEEDCSKAIQRSKFLTEAYKLRGFVREQMGKDSLALEDFEYGLSHNPTDREFLFYKAVAELNLKRYADADTTLGRIMDSNPKFYEAVTARAQLRFETGDTIGALADIDRTLQIFPSQDYPYALKAEIHAARQEWGEARQAMDEIVRLYPDRPDLYLNRAFLRYKDDDYLGAMSDYNETLHLDPYNSAALFNRGLLRFEVRELDGAAEDFTRVLDLDASNFHALYNRALVYLTKKDYQKAETDFRSIIKRYPRFYPAYYALSEIRYNLGDERGAVKNMMTAEDIVKRFVENPTKNPLDRPTIGQNANVKGRDQDREETEEELLEKFNQLVTKEVDTSASLSFNDRYKGRVQDRETSLAPEPLFHLTFLEPSVSLKAVGSYFKELGELNGQNHIVEKIFISEEDAPMDQEQIEKTFSMVEKYTSALNVSRPRAIDYIARGIAYTMLRNYESALADFDRALEIMPDYTVALMGKGYALGMLASTDRDMRPSRAIETYDSIIRKNPAIVYAWFNKGDLFYAAGDYLQAKECFSKAIELAPELGEAYYNRGLCDMQLGNRNEAFGDFSKAGELGVLQGYRVLKSLK